MIPRLSRRELIVLLAVASAFLVSGVAVLLVDARPTWRHYQEQFEDIVREHHGAAVPDEELRGIQQIWVEPLGVVDRCTTCHQGVQWSDLAADEHPWRPHPHPELLRSHPVEEYGCTSCHGGQGYALDEDGAHGPSQHWEEPLLGRGLAAAYDADDPPPLYEIRCNVCHRYERETPGMPVINRAKALVRDKGCVICHAIDGSGGRFGPDLTAAGDKKPGLYDFSVYAGEPLSVLNWHIAHFVTPAEVVPTSIMPDIDLEAADALALSMLMMSWRDDGRLRPRYLPGAVYGEGQSPEEMERDRRLRESEGAFFVENTCYVCHSVEAHDIQSPTDMGPDLSRAPETARARFSKTLDKFLAEPTGTMETVLESHIPLTEAQKAVAIEEIRRAYEIARNREQIRTGRPD